MRFCTLADSIGFLQRLPHGLFDAFRTTILDLLDSDVLIHVRDASRLELNTGSEEEETDNCKDADEGRESTGEMI